MGGVPQRSEGEDRERPDWETAYVTSYHSGAPINTATNTADRPVKVGKGPYPLAITP
jgi:DNA-binding beta-propeller fold protein YncE